MRFQYDEKQIMVDCVLLYGTNYNDQASPCGKRITAEFVCDAELKWICVSIRVNLERLYKITRY